MRYCFTILFILLSASIFSQSKKNILSKFDTKGITTHILYQKSPIIDINTYNTNTVNAYSFFQAYKMISQSDLKQRFVSIQTLKNNVKQAQLNAIVPLSILHINYETIKTEAFQNNKVTNDSEGFLIRHDQSSDAIFEKHQLTMASALHTKHKGLHVNFSLNDIYNTTSQHIIKVEVDFDNTEGYKTLNQNAIIAVVYPSDGKKTLRFRLTLEGGQVVQRTSSFEVKYSNSDMERLFNRMVTTIPSYTTPDLSIYNESVSYPGEGEYELFLSSDNILDKPIFLVDGFDPGDGRDITGLYNLLNFDDNGITSNLGDLVRAEGFDLVILNFPVYTRSTDGVEVDGGVDFIERNAMILVNLINIINAQKVGEAKNVVIGPSMGGLISRYALNFMEQQNIPHETRLWISFDSPHHGANVPIGFQHQFNFLAYGLNDFWFIGDQNVEELQPVINGMLKSSAARQMLTDQLEAHFISNNTEEVEFDPTLTLPQAHPFKAIFDNRINALTSSGFPETVRNVSIINGSGINSRYQDNLNPASDLLPSRQILNTTFNVTTGTDTTLRIKFTPYSDETVEASYVYVDFAWYIPAFDVYSYADTKGYSYSDGIDAASGGLFDIIGLTSELDTTGIVGDFLNALQTDYFNFIPSVSAMAFEISDNEIDWFYAPNNVTTGRATTNITPFDNWYMPDENELHVTLTDANVDFALYEILQPTLNLENNNSAQLQLLENPVNGSLIINSNIDSKVKINVVDTAGKIVVNTDTTVINGRNMLPVNLASGFYILSISIKNEASFITKLLVN